MFNCFENFFALEIFEKTLNVIAVPIRHQKFS